MQWFLQNKAPFPSAKIFFLIFFVFQFMIGDIHGLVQYSQQLHLGEEYFCNIKKFIFPLKVYI